MNKLKRIAAVLLCLAMLLALAACGSFEQRMLRAASKLEKLQSYHSDSEMTLDVGLSLMGQSMDMDVKLSAASDVDKANRQRYSIMSTELMGESMEILSYVMAGEEEGSFDSYISTDSGASWQHGTVTADELKEVTNAFTAEWPTEFLVESAKSFTENGKETVNGSQATRFDGLLEGEAVGRAVEDSGVLDSFGDALPLDLSAVFDKMSGSIPVSIWVDDKSGMLVRYDMDMTEVFASVWDTMLAELMESEELGDLGDLSQLGLEMELRKMFVSITLSDFDAVGEIVLPEAAKAA